MKKYVLTAITLMLGLGTFFLVGYVIDGSENDSQTTSPANQNAYQACHPQLMEEVR